MPDNESIRSPTHNPIGTVRLAIQPAEHHFTAGMVCRSPEMYI